MFLGRHISSSRVCSGVLVGPSAVPVPEASAADLESAAGLGGGTLAAAPLPGRGANAAAGVTSIGRVVSAISSEIVASIIARRNDLPIAASPRGRDLWEQDPPSPPSAATVWRPNVGIFHRLLGGAAGARRSSEEDTAAAVVGGGGRGLLIMYSAGRLLFGYLMSGAVSWPAVPEEWHGKA